LNVNFDAIIRKNIFNSDNYKVYSCDIDVFKFPNIKLNNYGNVTISGNIHELIENVDYNISAEELNNKYGYTYKIKNIKRERPKSIDTVKMFLDQILTPEQTNQLITHYPDIIDRVINNRLNDIDLGKLYNIGKFRFEVIKRKIIENFALAEMIEEFKGLLDFKISKILLDKYLSIENVKENLQNKPYMCLCKLSGVSFKTADKILLDFNKECENMKLRGEKSPIIFTYNLLTSVQRAVSAIEYLLEQNENDGHTRISIVELRTQFDKLVPECSDKFVEAIKNSEDFHVDKESKTISILETYNTELYIAERLIEGLNKENKWDEIEIDEFRKIGNDELTDEQFNAVKMFYENNISILNGGGGVGKSFTTQAILSLIKKLDKSFHLLCPTGRASKVLAGYTNEDTYTIHRGLAYNPSIEPPWGYNEHEKLPYDVVIVDEMSMTDIFLMKHLLEAIDFSRTKLLMIGDDFQIPSVGAGNVLYDLINSDIIPITSLTKVFRFGIGGISTISTKTRYGEPWIEDKTKYNIFGEDKAYVYMPMSQIQIIQTVKNLYLKLMNSGISPEDILILSSYNIGDYGTEKINSIIQKIANKNYDSDLKFKCGDTTYYLDDIVIQTKNNYKAIIYDPESFGFYDKNSPQTFISNGDIGKVILIDRQFMVVQFDDERIVYNREAGLSLKLAYSISLYKSQGGSAKNIILITPKAHTYMLNANLIYVGQTRAEKRCYHIGEPEVINRALKKRANLNRSTHLLDLLRKVDRI